VKPELRDYQHDGLTRVASAFAGGARRVVAVAPTGSGKGTMAASELARHSSAGERCLLLVHRREIVKDLAKRAAKATGKRVGVILPGERDDPKALIRIASVQSVVRRPATLAADFIIVDEAHHYAADEWGAVLAKYPTTPILGFTATPQRADGRALGDVFDSMVVVVGYATLIQSGHIVPCEVLRPPSYLGIDLAQDPLDAYMRYAMDQPALIFVRRVDEAKALYKRFLDAGIVAAVVHANTGASERDETLKRLADGRITVVINVFALTEGVDVSRVSTIVLARTCDHVSTYVQIVGRALRSHPGKTTARLLDLTGVSHKHGLPTDDREYSLAGSGMGPGNGGGGGPGEARVGKVLGLDLNSVAGELDAARKLRPDPKRLEWEGLAADVEAGRMTVATAVEQYRSSTGERPPWVNSLSRVAKLRERERIENLCRGTAMSDVFVAKQYEKLFGVQHVVDG